MVLTKQSREEALSDALLVASSLILALMNTFDDEASHSMMPPKKMHSALFALNLVVDQAKELADG